MFKKITVSGCLKFVIILIVALSPLISIQLANAFSEAKKTLLLATRGSEQIISNHAIQLKHYLIAETIFVLIIIFAASLFIKALYSKNGSAASAKDLLISEQQRELEKQNKVIDNLTNLYNDAVEYDRVKTEFFSNISHELRTHLCVILGSIQLIEHKMSSQSSSDVKSSRHIQAIKQNCLQLLRLINNTLDITRIDSGYIKFNPVNCNVVYLVEDITQSVILYAEQKNLSLEFDTESEEIITAVDIDKIERIILNLLSNAIKFTPPEGKISVNVYSAGDKVFISVKDTGCGIPSSMRDLIFERFRQVNNTLTKTSEGSGIGLSLAKCFVELHDGSITVTSDDGKGSEFIVELPIKICESSIEGTPQIYSGESKKTETLDIEFSDIYAAASKEKEKGIEKEKELEEEENSGGNI